MYLCEFYFLKPLPFESGGITVFKTQVGLELVILLPQPPEHKNYSYVPPHQALTVLFVGMCAFRCVCVCCVYTSVPVDLCTPLYVAPGEDNVGCPALSLCFIPLSQGLPLKLELGLWLASPSHHPVFISNSSGLTAHVSHPAF